MLNDPQHTMTRTTLSLKLFTIVLTIFFLKTDLALAIGRTESTLPNFPDFYKSVQNGEADVLRGVYVPNVLALPIVQQPANRPFYVSTHNGELTQFSIASQYGNTGLLAHNTLSGRFFSGLAMGQEVRLIYGDGKVEYFVIKNILRFQALQPESVSSSFRNLDRNEVLSAGDMFNRAYVGDRRVVFQTCIAANGDSSWGRLFIVAIPKKS
ncbi:MAG TPA: hypothetical protein VK249_27495 [Anaerolineales bacterium]|nr:hypothetical protein [Anaerolineales bacterium]